MSNEGRFCQHDMLYQTIFGTNVDLVVLGPVENDSGYLSCVTKIDLPAHLRFVQKIQQETMMMEMDPVHCPENGEICLVQHPELGFLRCKCLRNDVGAELVLVYAIDYGVVCYLPAKKCRVIHMIIYI